MTSCSTGGLQSPPCNGITNGPTCNFGDIRGSIMGAYLMIGVPLYAATLGMKAFNADILLAKYYYEEILPKL